MGLQAIGTVAMLRWFESLADFQAVVRPLRDLVRPFEDALARVDSFPGWCPACRGIRRMSLVKPTSGGWCNLRNDILCECGLNGRSRMCYEAIMTSTRSWRHGHVLMFEQVTPFYTTMSALLPNLSGCEYLDPKAKPGSHVQWHGKSIRHEDMMNLSCGDNSLDHIFHGDVLEHVPDYKRALAECRRVMKPGAEMLFTCPFYHNTPTTLVRSEMVGKKRVDHAPPQYHGNPVSDKGSLVYIEPGCSLVDEISNAGFREVSIGLDYDVASGIVSDNNVHPERHMWPVIFRAIK